MTIGELCNREVVVVHKGENALEAAKLMRQYHVGDVVVVEDRDDRKVPAGILTDRDIVIELVAEQVDPESVTVEDVMSDQLLVINESDELLDTMEQMRDRGVRQWSARTASLSAYSPSMMCWTSWPRRSRTWSC